MIAAISVRLWGCDVILFVPEFVVKSAGFVFADKIVDILQFLECCSAACNVLHLSHSHGGLADQLFMN
ncbi:hypothetical protein D3C78_1446600 [compost metagenome]